MELKKGAEAAQRRHWDRPKETMPGLGGEFLAHPKHGPDPSYFDNPLRKSLGEKSPGLFSIREDAQEVQRNASNYSTTSRDALLPSSLASAGDGSLQHGAGSPSSGLSQRHASLPACTMPG